MNSRQQRIINQLTQKKTWVKGEELAALAGVTSRTIRSDIEKINSGNSQVILSNTRKGYRINNDICDGELFLTKELGPQTPQERALYIIKLLLVKKEPIKIRDLVDQLFVSEHTIESDIKKIREMLDIYSELELVRTSNSLLFKGDEKTKRDLYRKLLDEEIQGNFLNINKIADLYDDFNLLEVMSIFEEVLYSYNYTMREEAIPILTVHIGITMERILSKNYLTYKESDKKLCDKVEYQIVKQFFNRVENILPIDFREEEVFGLTTTMIGYRDASSLKDEISYLGERKNLSQLLDEILSHIDKVFDLDFSADKDFISGLHLHIQSLANRIENGTSIPNVHHEEIKQSYPLIFEIGVHVAQIITDYFSSEIPESEISFITLHIGAAYSRFLEKEQSKYRVLLIAPENESFLRLINSKITSMFKERMEIVKVSHYLLEQTIHKEKIDLIITTLPIKHNLDIEIVKITMFFGYEDESKIFRALNTLDKKRFIEEFSDEFGTLIDERFYFSNLDLNTREEVITFMSEKLEEENIVSSDFKKSVLDREKMAATSFAYSVAVPHSLTLMSNQSKIVIGILKKPIKWNNYDVQLVIMPVIKESDSHKMWLFFDWLSETIMDIKKMTKLIGSKTKKEFVHWMLSDKNEEEK